MKLETIELETPYLLLDEEFYDLVEPIPLEEPFLISYNPEAAKLIKLEKTADTNVVALLNGALTLKGSRYFSMCYAGHQFGNYAPRLGDGRASNLGKVDGWNLQTKGSGETLYSRMSDGRAAVRSSIREYLMSEAIHHLGIPTTRALALIGSKSPIVRNRIENAAVLMRMSTSWIRFGSFEYFYYDKQHDRLKELAQYTIEESFAHLQKDEDRFYKMFCEVVDSTASLIAQWQGVGFCHGVMNTDNMSITGLTLDYGPFAMMDNFNYGYICNHTDKAGRYSYAEQPNVSYWNLTKLSEALSPLVALERMKKKLEDYGNFLYPNAYISVMRTKLGLLEQEESEMELIEELLVALQNALVDYTLFFRTLSHYDGDRAPLYDIAMNPIAIDKWLIMYDARLEKETRSTKERSKAMLATNPKYVLKNHRLQEAIELAEKGDFSMVQILLYIGQHPFEELEEYAHFASETPEEHQNIGLACSS